MSPLRSSRVIALVAALLMLTAACGSSETPPLIASGNNPATAPRDLVATLEAEELTSLLAAIEAADLVETLQGEGPFTVFAPSEAAFEALPDGLLPLLLEPANKGLLTDIVEYHVAEGLHLSADLVEARRISTLEGSSLTVESVEEPGADGAEPTTRVEIGGSATLGSADQFATNGVIHEIDTVLVPADRADDLEALVESIPEIVDVVSTLEATSNVSTFVELLDAAGLTSEIEGDGPFTVFAPSNAAFSRLSAEQRQVLDENPDLLEAVLRFHLVRHDLPTTAISTQRYVTTLEGQGARFVNVGRGSSFTFGGATLSTPDLVATNGVVHVIDQVLIPDSVTGPGGL